MSRTLGAPLGGTTRGAHQAFDFKEESLISPPNFESGAGNCLPEIVVVPPGEPGEPVVWISALVLVVAATKPHASSALSSLVSWFMFGFIAVEFRQSVRFWS